MTGDGAVVRLWARDLNAIVADYHDRLTNAEAILEHNAAIRQQAAEIEGLTRDRAEKHTTMLAAQSRALTFKARSADLLKALERIADEQKIYKGHGDYDIIPALEADEAPAVARAAITAAKETV